MKRSAPFAVVLIVAVVAVLGLAAQGQTPNGKDIFLAQKCNLCHGVSTAGIESKATSEKMKGPDLVNLDPKLDAAWLAKYLRKTEKKDGKAHMKEFKGTDEELEALITWLKAQKK